MLTCGTALDILVHKVCEAWPPELDSDKLVGLEITRVSSGLMVMAVGEDGSVEGVLWRNIHMAFVSEEIVIIFPVGEMGSEGSRDIL